MLQQARQRTAVIQRRLKDSGISGDGRLGGWIGESIVVAERGADYPRDIRVVAR